MKTPHLFMYHTPEDELMNIVYKTTLHNRYVSVVVNIKDYKDFSYGRTTAQSAFPYLSPEEREIMISGYSSDEWKEIMGDYEELGRLFEEFIYGLVTGTVFSDEEATGLSEKLYSFLQQDIQDINQIKLCVTKLIDSNGGFRERRMDN